MGTVFLCEERFHIEEENCFCRKKAKNVLSIPYFMPKILWTGKPCDKCEIALLETLSHDSLKFYELDSNPYFLVNNKYFETSCEVCKGWGLVSYDGEEDFSSFISQDRIFHGTCVYTCVKFYRSYSLNIDNVDFCFNPKRFLKIEFGIGFPLSKLSHKNFDLTSALPEIFWIANKSWSSSKLVLGPHTKADDAGIFSDMINLKIAEAENSLKKQTLHKV
jgi:hypothetical protein